MDEKKFMSLKNTPQVVLAFLPLDGELPLQGGSFIWTKELIENILVIFVALVSSSVPGIQEVLNKCLMND